MTVGSVDSKVINKYKKTRPIPIVKVTLNLSLLRCMFFAHCSSSFHPILMKFEKL